MADQFPNNLVEDVSVEDEDLLADAMEMAEEQEMPPVPQELIVQIPEPDNGTIRRRRPRTRMTARKSVICRRAYFKLHWNDDPLVSDPPSPPPPPQSPVKKLIESKTENSVSEEEPLEMEPEPSEQSMDDTAQSKFALTFASAADYPGPCPYGNCGWLDD